MEQTMNKVVIVDDHQMVCKAFQGMVDQFEQCGVLFTCANGRELLDKLKGSPSAVPDVILLDINMPIMDGYATMKELHELHPEIRVLALSMNDDEASFLKMIDLGAHGFVSKLAKEQDLEKAIEDVMSKGCYYTSAMADLLFRSIQKRGKNEKPGLSDRELELLKLIPTEMTYAQIADKMNLSPKTVDGYRNSLFQKLEVKSRVGLAMYAVREGYFEL